MQTYDKSMATRFTQLLAEREDELRALLRTREDWPERIGDPESRDVSDFKDMATQSAQAALDEVQAEHVAFELEDVLAAQHRLRKGTYGRCQQCGEEMDVLRLETLPATPYCTTCQSMQERERQLFVKS